MRFWLTCLAISFAVVASTARAQEVTEEARALFREGVALLKHADGADYVGAYEKFQAAYEASKSPKILGNLGLCALKLERLGEAREAYEEYLAKAPKISAAERAAIRSDLDGIEKDGATINLALSTGETKIRDERTTRDGKLVVNEYTSAGKSIALLVQPGKHRFVVTAAGHRPGEVSVELEAGVTVDKDVSLEPVVTEDRTTVTVDDISADDDGEGGLGVGFWVSFSVTAAAGIAAGVVGGLTVSKSGAFDDAKASGDIAKATELQGEGQTLSITTDVLLGVTGAAAILTTIFLITDLTAGDSEEARVRVGPGGLVVAF